jgi:hypothetical protein
MEDSPLQLLRLYARYSWFPDDSSPGGLLDILRIVHGAEVQRLSVDGAGACHVTSFRAENVDLNMHDFVKVMCNLLDIPVYQNHVESLHVLFTLFAEFKNNPFLQGGGGGGVGGSLAGMGAGSNVLMMDG